MNATENVLEERLVGAQVHREIEQFLYREARLLDTERLDDWLALMADDVHYWMPSMENRRRNDKHGAYQADGGAFFNDNLRDLTRRVARFKQPTAWAEDPPTRHTHVVSGIEAFAAGRDDEYVVHSTFVNYRSRVEKDNDLLVGRREDLLRRVDGGLRIARRKVLITQSILMAKNLNTFL
ncbi:3-phenylpropionate/cinnamic acid dioxygenase subunit beta [Piscinibacter gummiphilus]|uniref:3-phenylpropionate dioxygenase n=1 Tax=Piscinibacter gummiphilus TaxID=946333 RepID=A0A1W6L5Z8_9BURK|nr:3-phenylpropionate/cinnamic acid dioxygenase subunit beta [Piscinibacter gummiphilus]ARN19626.1 3-phenylpropionate dioxygenase [Piscinibacter gummiphilus]ATU64296.1 3-phenylpropionate dioxygenase [Piscinibacter gummiphilus]GLS93495.1 hypothetical biphenyl dioxygenase beta subunit [Piscinibacter gummiphilus]